MESRRPDWNGLHTDSSEPLLVGRSTAEEVPAPGGTAQGPSQDSDIGKGKPIGGTQTVTSPDMVDPNDSPGPVSCNDPEACSQYSQCNLLTPSDTCVEDGKPRSESCTTDSGDSEIYEYDDSIFAGDEDTLALEEDICDVSTYRIQTLYANCLNWLICRQVFNGHPVNAGPSENTSCSQESSSSSSPMHRSASEGKRRADRISRKGHGGSHDNGEEGDDDETGPRPTKNLRTKGPKQRRFACPFFKRHPGVFRSCGMSDYENTSRIKQHIIRKHKMPIYCPRCSAVFESESVRDSHNRENSCFIRPQKKWICTTSEQLRQLSRRSKAGSDTDKWNEVYGILFPGHPIPDSPHLDTIVSAEVNLVREAFLDAAPAAARTAVQIAIPEVLRDTRAEEFERLMLSTHVEVFDRILRRMRLEQSDTQTQPPFYPEASDSGIGRNVSASGDKPEMGSPPGAQRIDPEQMGGTVSYNEDILSGFAFPEDKDFAQLALRLPSESWDFRQPNDLLCLTESISLSYPSDI